MSRCGPSVTIVAQCQPDCPELPEIEFQNINLSGVGVLDSWDGVNGNFRGVASANSMLTVTLDNVNHNALLTVVPAAIQAQFTTATESAAGILELATQAEVTAGTDDTTAVTPLKLATRLATTSLAGLIEIATLAEVQAGTATNLAVVPDTLGDMVFLSGANMAANVTGGPVDIDISAGNLSITSGGGATSLVLNSAVLDFTGAGIAFAGAAMNINSVLVTDAVGFAAEKAINEFLSTDNTNSGWTAFTNASVLKTCDVNTVTLPQLASILNTLVTTFKSVQIPIV